MRRAFAGSGRGVQLAILALLGLPAHGCAFATAVTADLSASHPLEDIEEVAGARLRVRYQCGEEAWVPLAVPTPIQVVPGEETLPAAMAFEDRAQSGSVLTAVKGTLYRLTPLPGDALGWWPLGLPSEIPHYTPARAVGQGALTVFGLLCDGVAIVVPPLQLYEVWLAWNLVERKKARELERAQPQNKAPWSVVNNSETDLHVTIAVAKYETRATVEPNSTFTVDLPLGTLHYTLRPETARTTIHGWVELELNPQGAAAVTIYPHEQPPPSS